MCSKPLVCIIHMSSQHSACTQAEPENPQQTFCRNYLNLPFIGIDYCLCTKIHTQQCRDGGLSTRAHVLYIYTYAICATCLYIHLQNQALYACFSTVVVLSNLRVAFQPLEFKCLSPWRDRTRREL